MSKQALNRVQQMLGDERKANAFLQSVISTVGNNDLLQKATPQSVMQSALVAASLDLPVQPELGFAYIVPYKGQAAFQLGYKGLIQLCQRSGQYRTISAAPIYEGQIESENPLTGYRFNFDVRPSGKPVGYAAYFELVNGFQKTLYMSAGQLEDHAQKYSQSYKRGFGVWKDNFEAMAKKTVLKLLLKTYGPMSTEMQKAVLNDQGVSNGEGEINYPDNETENPADKLTAYVNEENTDDTE